MSHCSVNAWHASEAQYRWWPRIKSTDTLSTIRAFYPIASSRLTMVRSRGLEPPHPYEYMHLILAHSANSATSASPKFVATPSSNNDNKLVRVLAEMMSGLRLLVGFG